MSVSDTVVEEKLVLFAGPFAELESFAVWQVTGSRGYSASKSAGDAAGPPPISQRRPSVMVAQGPFSLTAPQSGEIAYLNVGRFSRPILPRTRVWRTSHNELLMPQPTPGKYWIVRVQAHANHQLRLDTVLSTLCTYRVLHDSQPQTPDTSSDDMYDYQTTKTLGPSALVLDAIETIKQRSVPVSQARLDINNAPGIAAGIRSVSGPSPGRAQVPDVFQFPDIPNTTSSGSGSSSDHAGSNPHSRSISLGKLALTPPRAAKQTKSEEPQLSPLSPARTLAQYSEQVRSPTRSVSTPVLRKSRYSSGIDSSPLPKPVVNPLASPRSSGLGTPETPRSKNTDAMPTELPKNTQMQPQIMQGLSPASSSIMDSTSAATWETSPEPVKKTHEAVLSSLSPLPILNTTIAADTAVADLAELSSHSQVSPHRVSPINKASNASVFYDISADVDDDADIFAPSPVQTPKGRITRNDAFIATPSTLHVGPEHASLEQDAQPPQLSYTGLDLLLDLGLEPESLSDASTLDRALDLFELDDSDLEPVIADFGPDRTADIDEIESVYSDTIASLNNGQRGHIDDFLAEISIDDTPASVPAVSVSPEPTILGSEADMSLTDAEIAITGFQGPRAAREQESRERLPKQSVVSAILEAKAKANMQKNTGIMDPITALWRLSTKEYDIDGDLKETTAEWLTSRGYQRQVSFQDVRFAHPLIPASQRAILFPGRLEGVRESSRRDVILTGNVHHDLGSVGGFISSQVMNTMFTFRRS